MKLWELISACRTAPEAIERASKRPEWRVYYEAYHGSGEMLANRDRRWLDTELPDAFCREVLGGVGLRYHIHKDHVRTARGPGKLSAVEVFDLYGGSFLEDVNEKGSRAIWDR